MELESIEAARKVDERILSLSARGAKGLRSIPPPPTPKAIPKKLDLSDHLRFVRLQPAFGCWGYATLAVWDIMNDIVSPYSPNLSFELWRTLFYKQVVWKEKGDGVFSPDGRYHKVSGGSPEKGKEPFFKSFGCTTEGTDPTVPRHPTRWLNEWSNVGWSAEGVSEASNYRIESQILELDAINSDEFVAWLSNYHPLRVETANHVVAVVGFDLQKKEFKYVNSYGDKWGKDGYATFTFDELNSGKPAVHSDKRRPILNALVLVDWNRVPPPKPVPAARILVKHNSARGNVHLWLSAENSPHPRQQIWPRGWDDNSKKLHYTVRLPSEFIWPPTQDNRLLLHLYDAATYSSNGGTIKEFTAAFGHHTFPCPQLASGTISFKARERLVLTVP